MCVRPQGPAGVHWAVLGSTVAVLGVHWAVLGGCDLCDGLKDCAEYLCYTVL